MEHMEPDREAQVWQRVMGAPQAGQTAGLREVLDLSREQAAAYRRLAQEHSGKTWAKKLWEEEVEDAACLRGMCILSGEPVGKKQPWLTAPQGGKLLPLCYHRARRLAGEYTARLADPQFGLAFEELAKRQRERCILILKILGGWS